MSQPITIDLAAPTQLAELPVIARRVLAWWLAELTALAPSAVKRRLPKPRQAALLHVGQNWRLVTRANGAYSNGEGETALDRAADDSALAETMLHAAPEGGLSRLTVVLPRRDVLTRRIELPVLPEAQLRPALELQIDHISPFKADAVRFAARIAARDPIKGTMLVDVVIAPRARIAPIEERLAKLGFRPAAIDVETQNGGQAGVDLSASDALPSSRRRTLINAGCAAAAVAMALLASYAWSAAREGELEGWRTRAAELRPLAQRSADLRRRVEAIAQPFAAARAHQSGVALGALSELTNLLPDDVRLTEFRMTEGAIQITGLAANAPALIQKLEASKRFAEVKFRSPVMRQPNTTVDRFEIAMKLEGARAR